jgi:hypothetical protein
VTPEQLADFTIRVAQKFADQERRITKLEAWITSLDSDVRDLEDITVPDLADRLARLDRGRKGGRS